jgi:putative ATP-binding cassette transporter
LPYLPLGNLRDISAYPSAPDAVTTDEVQQALLKVALPHLIIRINEIKDWAKVLSVGEQQRIAFARILLNRPMVVFLDEATSGMDEGLELTLYHLLRTELPRSIVVSVSHRDTVEQHHDRQLELLGDGAWRLDRLAVPG